MEPSETAADLMTAASRNDGAWTAIHCPDANVAQAVREICRRDERFETRPDSREYPNTVAIRMRGSVSGVR